MDALNRNAEANARPFFFAKYFKGIRPEATEVGVAIEESGLRIKAINHEELSHWELQKIKRHSYDGKTLIVKYGDRDPFEYLEIVDQKAISGLDRLLHRKKLTDSGSISLSTYALIRFAAILGSILMLIGVLYYLVMPLVIRQAARWIPVEWEKSWAMQAEKQYHSNEMVDSNATAFARKFYKALNHQSPYDIRIFVLKDSVVNAFAMPGGILVIHSAMIDRIQTGEQLTGLLGHEIAHIEKRHSLQSILKSVGAMSVIQLLFGGLDLFSGVLINQMQSLDQLSYSRSLESEADRLAIDFCLEKHIDPKGVYELFEILQQEENKIDIDVPGFMRTHPLTADRIDQARQLIENKASGTKHWTLSPELELWFCELKQ